MNYKLLYPDGKAKALTFSYDDGVIQDERLVRLFNEHGVKATLNLNSGLNSDSWWEREGARIRRLSPEEMRPLYKGHEIAVHTCTHPHLEELDRRRLYAELYRDRETLAERFGCAVSGMALPFGSTSPAVQEAIAALGFLYCRNTVSHHTFALPEDFLAWGATCHHKDPALMELAARFRETDEELALFYVWGHSFEFDMQKNWQVMEDFLAETAGRPDTWYATNGEVASYITAAKRLVIGEDFLLNPTETDLWVRAGGETLRVPAGQWVDLAD